MKSPNTLIAILCSIFFVAISSSCNKDNRDTILYQNNSSDTNYCGCNADFIKKYIDLEVTLISSTDTTIWNQNNYSVLFYDKDSLVFYLMIGHSDMYGTSKICNSDEIIANWNYTKYIGSKIKISGDEYKPCYSPPLPGNSSYSEITITEIKQ